VSLDTVGKEFNEIPVFCDDNGWIWLFLQQALKQSGAHFVKLPTSTSIRQSWERFKGSQRIVIHWEGKHRIGGALIEEILDINPQYDVAQNIIVVMAVPIRDDILYLSELGVKRIVRIRHKDEEFRRATDELRVHLRDAFSRDQIETGWLKLQRAMDFLVEGEKLARLERLYKLAEKLHRAQEFKPSARFLDVEASLAAARGESQKAERHWLDAIALNPAFFRAYQKLASHYKSQRQYQKALDLLQRAHILNKQSIARLSSMGELHLAMEDDLKAEHFFKRALGEDTYCSAALNGLAEIRFRSGDLEETRHLLARTSLAYKFAAKLNVMGVDMVKQQKYQHALEHYTRAQYVLPNKDKGPQLFFNIGLCYHRWEKPDLAIQFLRIALIKEPSYKKASDLLMKIESDKKAALSSNAA
jgi:tetratricopeptide (TPR) repeat protein